MKYFVTVYFCFLFACLAVAEEKLPRMSFADDLVEISYALDDKPTGGFPDMGHTVMSFYISRDKVGMRRFIYNHAGQGGFSADTNAVQRAVECSKILALLEQPKKLPDSPNHILSARYLDGGKVIEKKFPIQEVPVEIRKILISMNWSENWFGWLKFVEKTDPQSKTNVIQRVH